MYIYIYRDILSGSLEGSDFRIPTCHEMVLELVWGADFWCNRHCRTSPVVLERFWGQVWPKIGRKPEKSEYRIANESLRYARVQGIPGLGIPGSQVRTGPGRPTRDPGTPCTCGNDWRPSIHDKGPKPYEFIGFGAMDVTKPYEFIGFGAMDVTKPYECIGTGAMDGGRSQARGFGYLKAV